MLRNTLAWFFIFSTAFLWFLPAKAVVFQAPSADSEDFKKYVLRTNQQTYAQWRLQISTSSTPEAHIQVLEFSQRALKEKPNKQVVLDWELLRTSIDLNRTDREVLTLLAEKLHFSRELCRYIVMEPDLVNLLENAESILGCGLKASPLPKALVQQVNDGEILVVDGIVFMKSQIPKALLAGKYQWRILSDRYEERSFVGTPEDFAKQKFATTNLIQGNCQDYKTSQFDFSLMLHSQIYFSDDCIKPSIPQPRTFSDWASEHKTLLWGLGILTSAVILNQLRDKTLVITRP